MKSKNTEKVIDNDFPKLMCGRDIMDLVVLFIESEKGVVVGTLPENDPRYVYRLGYYGQDWDMNRFMDFDGEITLSN